ncbi:MAG: hypothetical protein HMLIMOIP_002219 [Candidatus Nitrosomirales archaeon]|jgi:hypothetical protein
MLYKRVVCPFKITRLRLLQQPSNYRSVPHFLPNHLGQVKHHSKHIGRLQAQMPACYLLSFESKLSSSNRMYKTLILGESVPILFQRCNQNIIFIYYPYKLSITVKMENSTFCTYYYGPRSPLN